MCRKAKFRGSLLVVGKTIASHFFGGKKWQEKKKVA